MRRLLLIAALIQGCTVNVGNGGTGGGGDGGGANGTGGGTSGTGGGTTNTGGGTSGTGGGSGGTGFLASQYPHDQNIASDPDVVWAENFEEGTVASVTARYDDIANQPGMSLVTDVPTGSGGTHAMRWLSSTTNNATHVYKSLGAGYDELYVRWYTKYQGGIEWHHSGMWLGGYNPPLTYPYPRAGLKPDGDERFSVSYEIMGSAGANTMDFYDYWMTMHSWMAPVTNDGTSYYGNVVIHDPNNRAPDDTWFCSEIHLKLNTDVASGQGAVLEAWKNDVLVQRFDDAGPLGYWVRDKFCPDTATGTECTDYRPPASDPRVVLDQRYRNTTALKINTFWPQNYITSGPAGAMQLDDIVVAKRRVGCLR